MAIVISIKGFGSGFVWVFCRLGLHNGAGTRLIVLFISTTFIIQKDIHWKWEGCGPRIATSYKKYMNHQFGKNFKLGYT
jgi:hypothetical protein